MSEGALNSSNFKGKCSCVTWDLLLDPPSVATPREANAELLKIPHPEFASVNLSGFLARGLIQNFSFPLLMFLSGAVVPGGDLSKNSGLAAWVRLHLQQLTSSETPTPAVPLSPYCAPFPLADLAAFPCTDLSDAEYMAAYEKLWLAVENEAGQREPSIDTNFLINQILLRAALCLLHAVLSQENNDKNTIVQLAATFEILMIEISELSVGKVVQGAQGLLGVQEAAPLVAEMTSTLINIWVGVRALQTNDLEAGRLSLASGECPIKAVTRSLMVVRFLAAAGVGVEPGSSFYGALDQNLPSSS